MTDEAPAAPAGRVLLRQPVITAAWPYRCYVIKPFKKGWKAVNMLEFSAYDFPRSFYWPDRLDREGLRNYLDLVTAGRKTEALEFQDRGAVKDIEYDQEQLTGSIRINFARFLDILAHRGHLDIPLCEKLVFMGTTGRQLVPAEFIMTLAKYVPNPEWFGNPNDWRWMSRSEMDELDPLDVNSSMYHGQPNMVDAAETPGVAAAPAEAVSYRHSRGVRPPRVLRPPRENEVSRTSFDRHFELITVAKPDEGRSYFVRRLARFSGALLWAGTSYGLTGPWTEYVRDDSQLMALGIQV